MLGLETGLVLESDPFCDGRATADYKGADSGGRQTCNMGGVSGFSLTLFLLCTFWLKSGGNFLKGLRITEWLSISLKRFCPEVAALSNLFCGDSRVPKIEFQRLPARCSTRVSD